MDLNLVVLCGRLAAAPELRVFDSGGRLARLLLALRQESPRRRMDVVPIAVWDPPNALDDLAPGMRLWITGSVQRRFWEGREGRRSRLEVVAEHVSIWEPEMATPVVPG